MGWSNCGTDSKGRPIGYAHEATCDHHGCSAAIDRGLSYACGGMHGETEVGCEGYFCPEHMANFIQTEDAEVRVCDACAKLALASGLWALDEEEWIILPAEHA